MDKNIYWCQHSLIIFIDVNIHWQYLLMSTFTDNIYYPLGLVKQCNALCKDDNDYWSTQDDNYYWSTQDDNIYWTTEECEHTPISIFAKWYVDDDIYWHQCTKQ